MSKKKKNLKAKEINTGTELLENSEAIADRLLSAEQLVTKYRNIIIGTAVAIVLAVVGIFYYFSLRSSQEDEAQANMFPAVYYLQADSTKRALEGTAGYPGFEEISEDYPMSKAGNLAHFYAGIAYLKQGEFELAIDQLEQFSSGDLLLQARTYSLIGDAYTELKKYSEAADYYEQAVNYKPNKSFTPGYMMKQAMAEEMMGNTDNAMAIYEELLKKYPRATESNNAKKFKAKLEASAN